MRLNLATWSTIVYLPISRSYSFTYWGNHPPAPKNRGIRGMGKEGWLESRRRRRKKKTKWKIKWLSVESFWHISLILSSMLSLVNLHSPITFLPTFIRPREPEPHMLPSFAIHHHSSLSLLGQSKPPISWQSRKTEKLVVGSSWDGAKLGYKIIAIFTSLGKGKGYCIWGKNPVLICFLLYITKLLGHTFELISTEQQRGAVL